MNTRQMIEVLRAYDAGKSLELRANIPGAEWRPVVGKPSWNFYEYEFRVAED